MKRILSSLLVLAMLLVGFVGCSTTSAEDAATDTQTTTQSEAAQAEGASTDLTGQTLLLYSGAGLSKPVQEIVDTFKASTGCDVQVVFAATGQLLSQINTTQEGDVIIPGDMSELESIQNNITDSTKLVKHIPVLAVQEGNPKNITSVADLGGDDINVLIGDPETTPIGKIAVKAIEEAGLTDQIDIAASTTTAPAVITALTAKEADAGIAWKENVSIAEGVEIVDAPEMEKYIKTVPVASLSYSVNEEARLAFVEYMTGEEALAIWQSHGYELAE